MCKNTPAAASILQRAWPAWASATAAAASVYSSGAASQHLGECKKGEACLILSRDTYANSKHLVDELITTRLYRSGAPVRSKRSFCEDEGVCGGSPATATVSGAKADSQELIRAVTRVEDATRGLPSWVRIHWDQDDDAALEQRLGDHANDRSAGEVR